ncbi:phosphoenolpyruvate-utilizing N-terminal domain-containing protein, partial [Klebsiella pneumoniae]
TLDVQPVPESLSRLNPTLFHAHPVCAGSAGGTLVHLKSRDLHELGELPVAVSPEQEQAALDNGLRLLVKDIELRLLDNDGTASAILEAHRSLATDASLRQHLLGGILTGLSCAQAIVATGDHFCAQFRDSGNSYLQERVLDVR